MHTQELLGADIQMVLDVCVSLPSTPDVVRLGLERTSAWAEKFTEFKTAADPHGSKQQAMVLATFLPDLVK